MGVDIDAWSRPDALASAYRFKSGRHGGGINVEIIPTSHRDRWPEVHISVIGPERQGLDCDAPPPIPGMTTRIHGVTVAHLLDALIDDEVIFRYLASAVDYKRANGKVTP